jgi:hypothetical protein
MATPVYPVFIARGDALAEVDRLVRSLAPTPADAGLHKCFYVAKADQTVVMSTGRDTPLAAALRARREWSEPVEPA